MRFNKITESNMHTFDSDIFYMQIALQEAQRAAEAGEVPCGAVIVLDDQIIGKAHNQTEQLHDPTAHAEILAITQATQQLQNWRFNRAVMCVTKEPVRCVLVPLFCSNSTRCLGYERSNSRGAQSKFNILHDADLNHLLKLRPASLKNPVEILCNHSFKDYDLERRHQNSSDNA